MRCLAFLAAAFAPVVSAQDPPDLEAVPSELSDLKQERRMVSAVNLPGKPGSDGSQFFVCVSPQPALQGKYTVFARVVEGMDVVEQIFRVPVDADGVAQKPVRRCISRRIAQSCDVEYHAWRD